MRDELKLYGTFIKVYLKTKLQYPFALMIQTLGNITTISTAYIFLMVLFTKVESIMGWTYHEILFLVSVNWIATALSGFFFWTPMITQGQMIQEGQFDMMLIRPIHPLKFCIYRQFQHTFLGRLLLAGFFLGYSEAHLHVVWSAKSILLIGMTMIEGTLIHGGVWILLGASSFWFINNQQFVGLFTSYDGIRSMIDYPLSAFPKMVRIMYTVVMPYGFVNYYPVSILLHKESGLSYGQVMGSGILAAVLFFGLSIVLWNKGLKVYSSTGA